MSSLTKVSSMPKCFPSGLSLSGQIRTDTHKRGAGHTHGWRDQRLHETQSWLAPLPAPSLPGQCRIGTQRLAARHTYGWGANSPSEPKFSSLPTRSLDARPLSARYPDNVRRAHSQGGGAKGPPTPRRGAPLSPALILSSQAAPDTQSNNAGHTLKEGQRASDTHRSLALLRHHGYPPGVPSINNHPRYRSNYYAN